MTRKTKRRRLRNPFVLPALRRKGGAHGVESNKMKRRKQKQTFKEELREEK